MLITSLPLLDELLHQHADALGKDFTAYRHHNYRVVNYCAALCSPTPEALEKMAIAAAFHDLGIWTDHTFDYLAPSEQRAMMFLERSGRAGWAEEVGAMIREHHRIRRAHANAGSLAEPFRRADWIDVSLGLLRFGLPQTFLREVRTAFPNAGFHRRLVQLSLRRLCTHPWSPMPMMRL